MRNPWVKDPPLPDWFHGSLAHHIATQYDFNYLVDPHSTRANREPVLNGWFVDLLPDMNTENPAVAQYLRQNAVWWLEQTGADGLRIDTFAYVNRQFWSDYNRTLHTLFPHVTEVGEVLQGDPKITSFFAGDHAPLAADGAVDTGLTTPFDFPSYFALVEGLTERKPLSALLDILRQDSLYPHPERLITLIGNHDTPRFLSQKGATPERLRLAFGLIATMRGMPHLFYGDELGMTGGEDPDNRQDFPGGFSDKAPDASSAQRTAAHQATYEWVRGLLQFRSANEVMQTGQQQTLLSSDTAIAFARAASVDNDCVSQPEAKRFVTAVNNDKQARDLVIPVNATTIGGCSRFHFEAGEHAAASLVGNDLHIHLGPQAVTVLRAEP